MMQTESKFYFQRIFHPSDFSDASHIAFVHALKLAVAASGRLTILHTGSKRSEEWGEFPRVRGTLERWGLLPPGSSKETIFSLGLDVEKITSPHSDPVRSVLHYLRKHPHDLIVLATHQHDGFDRWTHKQVAEPIARRSGEMTLFIPHGVEGFVSFEHGAVGLRHILIPVDRTPDPQIAVDGALAIAHALECHDVTFTLLHVGDESRFQAVIEGVIKAERESWRWQQVARQGNVEDRIIAAANEFHADLIVMATQGHDGFLDALRGSTTERIVRGAHCPVLAVPAIAGEPVTTQEAFVWRPAV